MRPIRSLAAVFAPSCWALVALAALLTVIGCAPAPGEDVAETSAAVCSTATLAASPQGAAPGTAVTWTASAGCGTGDTPQYEFWMLPPGGSWSIVQPYGASSTYAWSTTGLASGTYDFEVWVRAAGSSAASEGYSDVTYQLGGSAACTSGALSFSPARLDERWA